MSLPPPPDRPPNLRRRLTQRRTLLSVALAATLLGVAVRELGPERLSEIRDQITAADPKLYAAALGVYYLAFPLRAVRWRILLTNAGALPSGRLPRLRDLSEIIYLSWFANSLTPAKLGDVYRGWLLRRSVGVSWSRTMGTIVAERLMDLMVLVSLLIGAGLAAYGHLLVGEHDGAVSCGTHPAVHNIGRVLVQVFAAGGMALVALVAGLAVFARFGARLEHFLPERVARIYSTFSGGLVLSFGRLRPLVALSLVAWAVEAGRFYFVGRAIGHELPLSLVLFFSLLSAFMTTIPITPGGLGFEPLLAGALCLQGYPATAAWALTVLDRSISYLSLVVGGAAVYLLSPKTK